MPRVAASDVTEIIQTSISDAIVLSSMIETATNFVDAHLLGEGHSSTVLTQIELYLAAHFVAITEERGGLTWAEYGTAQERLADVFGPGLASTRYGQTAMMMDTSGVLSAIGAIKPKAQFRVV